MGGVMWGELLVYFRQQPQKPLHFFTAVQVAVGD